MGGRDRGGFCFFFQAEDGIRDTSVTGVQTCALPIFNFDCQQKKNGCMLHAEVIIYQSILGVVLTSEIIEIGRASCRERV